MSNQNMSPCRKGSCCPKLYVEYADVQAVPTKDSLFLITDDYGGMVKLNISQLERLTNEAVELLLNHHVD